VNKKYVALFCIGLIVIFAAVFASTFLNQENQVQQQKMFRITVSKDDPLPMDDAEWSWFVHIELLSYDELKNAKILIDQGTPTNGESPFYTPVNNKTWDGRAQHEFWISWHPTNITMAWDGGSEIFLF
jgi:hypothetical protein